MKCKIPFLKHRKISYEKYCKHYAYGNIIDLMGSLIVMMFCFCFDFCHDVLWKINGNEAFH